MEYTVDYFIKKFKAVPEENWLTGQYANSENSKQCALGHCGERTNPCTLESVRTNESEALVDLFDRWLDIYPGAVNDGCPHAAGRYTHIPTPKARIIAALEDIKTLQVRYSEPTGDRIVYVVIDSAVKELQNTEDLCLN